MLSWWYMKFSEPILKEKYDNQKENLSFSHEHLFFCFSVLIMPRLPSLCCCILLFVLINSSQSNNPFSQFGVFCKTKMENQLVNKTGCDSRFVQVKACIGTCASYTRPLDHPPYFKEFCKCCKPSAKRWKMFNLPNCTSGISPLVQVEAAVNCSCSACSWKKKKNRKKYWMSKTENIWRASC